MLFSQPQLNSMTTTTYINTHSRNCFACDSSALETLWDNPAFHYCLSGKVHFPHNISICKGCGAVLQSPAYNIEDLDAWYSSQPTHPAECTLDYDIKLRLAFLEQVISNQKGLLDVGERYRSDFHNKAELKYSTVDICDINNKNSFSSGTYGIVTSYYLLEHTSNLKEQFSFFYQVLDDNGLLIIEVPDVQKYNEDISGLLLFEHVNHFSPNSLMRTAAKYGFVAIASSRELSSRRFGFAMAFRKTKPNEKINSSIEIAEYEELSNKITTGVNILKHNQQECRKFLDKHNGEKMLFWCANRNLHALLEQAESDTKHWICVDVNRQKADLYGGLCKVITPDKLNTSIHFDTLVICSEHNRTNIEATISTLGLKQIPKQTVVIEFSRKMNL